MQADELTNTIRIYRSAMLGHWTARIGEDDWRGVEVQGRSPCQALGRLVHRIHTGQYAFDPDWAPLEPVGDPSV